MSSRRPPSLTPIASRMLRVSTLALVVASVGCLPRTEGIDATKLPDDLREDYALFRNRCSRCHSLARPLNSGITDDQQWVMYVNRMRRQPGSGITVDDQEHILRFLRYYAAELRKKKEEKNAPSATPPASSPAPASPPPAPSAPPAEPPPSNDKGAS